MKIFFAVWSLMCGMGLAHAQWMWLDADGRKVYSDTAPPTGVSSQNIVKRPSEPQASLPKKQEQDSKSENKEPSKTSAKSSLDQELDAKKKQIDDAEKAKKQALEEKIAKERQENCQRAKQAKQTYDSGIRIAVANAKGEREFLDDKAKAQEQNRLQNIIQTECR